MLKNAINIFLFGSIVFGGAAAAYSKGSPDKIVISGGNIGRPLEITDRQLLKAFDPWGGQFIDWAKGCVAAPADQSQSYEVLFYMKWPGRRSDHDLGNLKMIYAVRYVVSSDGTSGYVYLPGEGEEFYSNNIGTIWREKDDGRWHRASSAWQIVMNRLTTLHSTRRASSLTTSLWSVALLTVEICDLLEI